MPLPLCGGGFQRRKMTHRQNYMARMELIKKNRLAAGFVSDVFPEVSEIVFHMTYYQQAINNVLMVRTVSLLPTGKAYFNMECMVKNCVDGGFDLSPVIAGLIKKHKKSGKGTMVCNGKNETSADDHASISYDISIKYKRKS